MEYVSDFTNGYDDGRIVIDPHMMGSDSDVNSYSHGDKVNCISDIMEWADIDNDWFANEIDDYLTQVMKDNGYTKISEFMRDGDLIDAVFQQIYKIIPVESEPEEATIDLPEDEPFEKDYPMDESKKEDIMIEIKEDVKVGTLILEAGDKIKVLKKKGLKEGDGGEIESMESTDGNSMYYLIEEMEDAFDRWVEGSRENFDDDDAREWGYRSIESMISEAKKDLAALIIKKLDRIAR